MSRILSVRNADFNCLFYLRKEVLLENGHHPIYVKLKFSRIGHVRKSTGYSCRPEDWIHESQRVRSQIRGGMELNANLVKFAKKALEVHHQIIDMDVTPPIAVVDQLLFGKQPSAKQKKLHESLLTFPEFVEWFFDNAEARLSENSIKAYKSGFQHLYAYAKSKGKEPGFRLFDRFFGDQFVRYLANKRISNNTSGKYLTALKIVLREAVRVGIQVTNDFESYKIPSAPVDFVYLTSEELEKLMHADLSIDVHNCSIADYNNKPSELAICIFTVLSYITTETEMERSITNIGKHIVSGGHFLFDLPMKVLFQGSNYNRPNIRRNVTITPVAENNVYHYQENCEGIFNGQPFQYEDEFNIRYWQPDVINAMLNNAGLFDTGAAFPQLQGTYANYKLYKKI